MTAIETAPHPLHASREARGPAPTKRALWIGRALSGLGAAFLLLDGVIKAVQLEPAVQGTVQLGYPESAVLVIGVLELVGLALYAFPRTSVLGAVYLTGFLGGAIATHVRVESPLLSHTLFPVYVLAFLWVGLCLRLPRLRAVLFASAAAR